MKSHPPLPMSARLTRSRGFSLIEVLVSIFIVSLGILALGGLLQSASRYGKMSESRSMATLLANDLADRIRANRDASITDYNFGVDSFPTTVPIEPPDKCTQASQCDTGSKLADHDLYVWTSRVRKMLPKGSAYIKFNQNTAVTPSGGAYDIWVAWTDPQTVKSGSATERSATECPPGWQGATAGAIDTSVRCVYIQVGL